MKPFLKWAGGKTQLLPELLARLPSKGWSTYYEPFLGGGALFFALRARGFVGPAIISDANKELIDTYRAIASSVDEVIEVAASAVERNSKEMYYHTRALNPAELDPVAVAARMLYLNKCGFNGLYRVNSKGGFNTPYGHAKRPLTIDADNLRACSEALKNTTIVHGSYDDAMAERLPTAGDLAYFDPPYVPLSETADFTAYTAEGFDHIDQERLAGIVEGLAACGVHVIASNAGHDAVAKIYSGLKIETVQARRNINSKGAKRGPVSEYIVTNWPFIGRCGACGGVQWETPSGSSCPEGHGGAHTA